MCEGGGEPFSSKRSENIRICFVTVLCEAHVISMTVVTMARLQILGPDTVTNGPHGSHFMSPLELEDLPFPSSYGETPS